MKYFASMGIVLRCSGLIYFLIIMIPENSNSPIPRMDFWLQKEQDDGFRDRDMTSSLTGDESFGSAHRSYENSLVRKERSGTAGDEALPLNLHSSELLNGDRHLRNDDLSWENQVAIKNINYDEKESEESPVEEGKLVSLEGDDFDETSNEMRDSKLFRKKFNFEKIKSDFLNSLYGQGIMKDSDSDLSDRKDNSGFHKNLGLMDPSDESCVTCEKKKETPSITLGKMEVLKLESPLRKKMMNDLRQNYDYINAGAYKNPEKSDLNKREQFDSKKFAVNEKGGSRENENENSESLEEEYGDSNFRGDVMEDSEDAEEMEGENDEGLEMDSDYNQLLDHDTVYKRDESKQRNMEKSNKDKDKDDSNKDGNPDAETFKDENSIQSDGMSLKDKNFKTDEGSEEDRVERAESQDNDTPWKEEANSQSKSISDALRESEKALQDAQQFQEKMAERNPIQDSNESKRGNNRLGQYREEMNEVFDRRSKREDEDEQKNMKTGTDEGGGEYEDEEGKGHNDEEEYYEESDYAEKGEDNSDHENMEDSERKNAKREASKGVRKTEDNDPSEGEDSESIDDESDEKLTLKNAPVENESTKDQKDGKRKDKKVVRKGAKIWDEWGKWSPCSATCGVGKTTRWRHCVSGGCSQGEKEAQIKKCTNPAC